MHLEEVVKILREYWQIPLLLGLYAIYEYLRYDALHHYRKSTHRVRAQNPKPNKCFLKKKPQGIVCGKYGSEYYCLPELKSKSGYEIMHALVIGGSGTGKTSSIYAESILSDWKNMEENPQLAFNFLAVDIKGEIHKNFCPPVGDPEECNAYYLLDPIDRKHSYGFDPFGLLNERDRDSLMQLSSDIAASFVKVTEKDPYFGPNGMTMLTGFIAFCMESSPKIELVTMMRRILQEDVKALLKEAYDSTGEGSATRFYLGRFVTKEEGNESLDDIISTMTTSLTAFGLDSVKYMLQDNPYKISMDAIREKPIILSVPDNMLDEQTFAPVYRMILTCIQRYLISKIPCDGERPVVLFYDEFFSLGGSENGAGIPGIQHFMSIARQYGVACCAAVQSEKMLVKQYGRDGANILEDNMVKIILHISDTDTIKAAQEWTGKFVERCVSTNDGHTMSSTVSWRENSIFNGSDFMSLVKSKKVIVVPLTDKFGSIEKSQWFKEQYYKKIQQKIVGGDYYV